MIPNDFYLENRYFYGHLKENEKELYRFMVSCLLKNQRKFIFISEFDDISEKEELLDYPVFRYKADEWIMTLKVWNALMWDCPEFYFVDIYDFMQEDDIITMGKEYDYYTYGEIEDINKKLNDLLKEFDDFTNPYEIELAVNNYIMDNYIYDNDTIDYYVAYNDENFDIKKWRRYKEKYNVVGLLNYGKGVCSAMAYLAQFIMQRKGIKVINMEGRAKRADETIDGHRWLAVMLENEYYFLDITWNNVLNKDPIYPKNMYFNVPYEEVKDYYLIYDGEYEDIVCNNDKYNYYKMNGLCFDCLDDIIDALEKFIKERDLNEEKNYFYFKMNVKITISDFRKRLDSLLDKYNIDINNFKVRKIDMYRTLIIENGKN